MLGPIIELLMFYNIDIASGRAHASFCEDRCSIGGTKQASYYAEIN